LSRISFFNRSWSDERIIRAVQIAYNEAKRQGIRGSQFTITVYGERITVFINSSGVLDSAWGSHILRLIDFGH